MTEKEKVKAYYEAIERTKKSYGNRIAEEIFPELKESEDEKIRRWIIDDIRYNINNESLNNSEYKKKAEKAIAWLEKQIDKDKLIQELGEYKVKYTQEVLEKYINSMSNKDDERLRKTAIAFLKDFAEQGYENAVECIDWLEKQCKQEQLYIHFGEIPTNEKSKIYRGEIEVGIENGVSVYPAFKTNEGNIVLGLNLPLTETTLHTQQYG